MSIIDEAARLYADAQDKEFSGVTFRFRMNDAAYYELCEFTKPAKPYGEPSYADNTNWEQRLATWQDHVNAMWRAYEEELAAWSEHRARPIPRDEPAGFLWGLPVWVEKDGPRVVCELVAVH